MTIYDHKSLTSLMEAIERQQETISETVRLLNQNDTVATMETTLSPQDLQHFKDMAHSLERAKMSVTNLQYWISEAWMYNKLATPPTFDDVLKLAIGTTKAFPKKVEKIS